LGAHVRGAVEDAALQRPLGARIDILGRERSFRLRHLADRFLEVALLGLAAVEDAGLVEMDVRLDEAGRHHPPAESKLASFGCKWRLDGGDAGLVDAEVDRRATGPTDNARAAQDQIHDLIPYPRLAAASSARRALVAAASTLRLSSSIRPVNTTP